MNKQANNSLPWILISLDEYAGLINVESTEKSVGRPSKKMQGKKVVLTPAMRKVVAARKLFEQQHHAPSPPRSPSPPIQSITKTTTTTTETATDEHGVNGSQQGVRKNKKFKKNTIKQVNPTTTTTTPADAVTIHDSGRSMSVECVSKSRAFIPMTSDLSDGLVDSLDSTITLEKQDSSSVMCLPLITPESPVMTSPLSSDPTKNKTASTITFNTPKSGHTSKRKRSTTPTSTKTNTYYTKSRVIDRETFSKKVEEVLEAASLASTHDREERVRRAELAAYFLDWHLNRAIEYTVEDLQRKFRK